MSSKTLLLDAGNTRLKWGICVDGRLTRTGIFSRDPLTKAGLATLAAKLPRQVDAVLASNVAGPSFGTGLSSVIGLHCDRDVQFARSEREAFGVRNAYRQPRRLGVDRWVAMIGARAESKSALCIVDAGSAITIDALDRNGQHLGGQIIPGLLLMHRSLESDTSGISGVRVRSGDPGAGMALFAKGTERGVQAGALNAICGAIERSVGIMRKEGLRPKIVLTGGGAAPIMKQLGDKVIHRPHLVLQGLAKIVAAK